ncbi:phosphatidylserine/phosphatidylglycerophosphate/cardiolipin synthase family protein [Paenibacillus doosanensis]|uniref:phospholipase D-like domain-containing protein n=1 Tax=Paenibacillus doosanensis TaxID=1229154 RepID=UPI00217F5C95|nr:phosphatidylserine/phosphatidylglycerophosphate/cardiolipin synthase family protein [Paenibacillus doosanensis]MCS7462542.1 phosphatidylserine/phosphatidylglycerophosphate/cardiolipin synthase family protein [Paenibacillus doosanensis]
MSTIVHLPSHIPYIESGSYPVRNGNAVHPLIDSAPTFRRICEAIEGAQYSVWISITFMVPDFQMPDGRGTILDVLDRAVTRGLDVRILFWRPNPESSGYGQAFTGSKEDHEKLAARGSKFRARWDRAHGYYCQHQKIWLIDAGHPSETSFVGGINPTFKTVEPGHIGENQRHDIYVEVSGPSASDVHHNFVQRWNGASERMEVDGTWGHTGEDELPFPTHVSAPQGNTPVQIQRNVYKCRYNDSSPTPEGKPFNIAEGEHSVSEQYIQAIDAARRTIYIENQALPIPEIAVRLEEALKRGVDIVLLVPADPEDYVRAARKNPERKGFFDHIEALGKYENFTLAGIAGPDGKGGRSNIYVHAKVMLVDDIWMTIGSCNLHSNSFFGHSEMNASIWDEQAVRTFRRQLLSEHLGQDTGHLDDRTALQLYQKVAHDNRQRRERGDFNWEGLVFSLDPTAYGE